MPRGKKMTEETKKKIAETREKNKESRISVKIESKSFTLRSDSLNWMADIDGKTIYHSRLDAMCRSILERKIKKSEAKDIQTLLDAITKATNEICFIVPKAVKS